MLDIRAAGQHPNVLAFKRVVREHESNQIDDGSDSAYTLINGGKHFFDFTDHPYAGHSTHDGGKAAGVAQFLPSTWADMQQQYGLGRFDPPNQEIAFTGCIVKRHALDDVIAGRFDDAVEKCLQEWTSLPNATESNAHYTMDDARKLFLHWGGTLAGSSVPTQPAAPVEDLTAQNEPQQGAPQMPIAAIISLFGPVLADLIPQMTAIFKPKGDVALRNTALAQTAIDTLIKVTGQPNIQAAIEAMQADKTVKDAAIQAVVTHPDILPFMEVGGGVQAARDQDLKVMTADKPFWKTSAVFWVSIGLSPLVYWYVGSSIIGGIDIPSDWPWFAQLPLKMFGAVWDPGARVGLANLVVGLVLGGIVGVYYGVSVTQAKQQAGTVTPPNIGG